MRRAAGKAVLRTKKRPASHLLCPYSTSAFPSVHATMYVLSILNAGLTAASTDIRTLHLATGGFFSEHLHPRLTPSKNGEWFARTASS